VEDERNRHIVARIPVRPDDDGLPGLARSSPAADERATAAILGGPGGRTLTDELAGDEDLGRLLSLPSKDNGLATAGIAAGGDRVSVGLRGPGVGGWAAGSEIRPYVVAHDRHRLRLAEIDGAPCRKHALARDALGIRDLCPHRGDLPGRAGPTMDLDEPMRV